MRSFVVFLQEKLPSFVQPLNIAKWQYVYYMLATFDVLTLSSSLYLSHRIMDIYKHSIEVNRQWAVRLETHSELSQLLGALNAPGNDVFESQNIELESRKLAVAYEAFRQTVNRIRQELQTQVNPAQAKSLLQDLDVVEAATTEMVAEAQVIFAHVRQNQPEQAGRHMAAMDRKYHQVNHALAEFRRHISQIQQDLLEQQKRSADAFRKYEFTIAGAMLLIIMGVTGYGHRLARKMKFDAQEKERSFAELQQAEGQLKEQTQQLQLTLENLQKTQSQLIQSEKMSSLGELVASVAHEINNPVNFIYGNLTHVQDYVRDLLAFIQLYQQCYPEAMPEIQAKADAIELEFLQDDLIQLLDSMHLGIDRICEIVLSLRNFSRTDTTQCQIVDIHEGINSTLLILHHRLKTQAHGEISVVKDYGTLPLVECYAGQLNQVFMNILSNAIDALEEQNRQRTAQEIPALSSQIRIRTAMIDDEWVEIAIADNGCGIPEPIRQQIFEPFFTTKPIGKGTGIGMSISYQIITEKHGGKLQCFSTIGKGTEFLIQIPIQQSVQEAV